MDKESTYKDFLSGIKPLSKVCQEYEALLKINQVTEKEIANLFLNAFGPAGAAMHIQNNFTTKIAKAILSSF